MKEVKAARTQILSLLAQANKTWLSDVATSGGPNGNTSWTLRLSDTGATAAQKRALEGWQRAIEEKLIAGRGDWVWLEGGIRDRLRGARGKMMMTGGVAEISR